MKQTGLKLAFVILAGWLVFGPLDTYLTQARSARWQQVDLAGKPVHAIDFASPHEAVFHATTALGWYTSDNAGRSWNLAGSQTPGQLSSGTLCPGQISHPTHAAVRLSCTSKAIFLSIDGGATWTRQTHGLPQDRPIHYLAFAPSSTTPTFFPSQPQGEEEYPYPPQYLPLLMKNAPFQFPLPITIYAGTDDGVWRLTFIIPQPSAE